MSAPSALRAPPPGPGAAPGPELPALRRFAGNLRAAPRRLRETMFRTGRPDSDRSRASFVFGNVFLHLHPARVHRWSLRPAFTFGLGILTLAAFLIATATGLLLMVYYSPSTALAYDSIKDIHFVVPTGRFIRNIHRWSANLMVVGVLLHMARAFYTGAYRAPRELNWVVGMVLLAITLGLSFTGYLLPWDQLAYWAVTIGANIAQSPREVTDALGITGWLDAGGLQKELLLGSDQVGQAALIRFYLLHVMVLPLALVTLLAVHFWRARKDGGLVRPPDAEARMGPPPRDTYPVFTEAPQKTWSLAALVKGKSPAVGRGPEGTLPSMPHLMYAEAAVLMLACFACVVLSLVSDAPLKELANPAVPENPAKAPWYFLGLQELVSFSAFMGGIGIPTIVLVGLGLIPFLDREQEGTGLWFGGPGGVRLVVFSACFAFAAVVGIEAFAIHLGWIREWWPGAPQLLITAVNPGTVLTAAYGAWSVWLVRRYDSTRAGALGLFTCFVVGFLVLTIVGVHFRGPNWRFYWSPSDWPGH
ncbi:MAG TPA: cytochrome b N-terminal domain-containing protein [Anaeromyxobacteraceae bacterium]|nr:cytochrome b N-terminal domain-containing protein [Anaeromyxobacteraceae bacterium]